MKSDIKNDRYSAVITSTSQFSLISTLSGGALINLIYTYYLYLIIFGKIFITPIKILVIFDHLLKKTKSVLDVSVIFKKKLTYVRCS